MEADNAKGDEALAPAESSDVGPAPVADTEPAKFELAIRTLTGRGEIVSLD